MTKALLVIDVQNYFINKHTKHLPKIISAFIKRNKNNFDYILFTKFINNRKSNFVKILKWNKCFKSPEIDIHKDILEFTNKNNVFVKAMFSPFKSKKFISFMKKNRINELYVCGTDTEACVYATAIDAFDMGYKIKILKNLCGSHHGKKQHKIGCRLIEENLERKKYVRR